MCGAHGDETTARDDAASRKRRAESAGDDRASKARDSRHTMGALCEALDAMSRRSRPGTCAGVRVMADMPCESDVEAWLRARDGTWDVKVDFIEASAVFPVRGERGTVREEEVCRFDGRPGRSDIHRLTIEEYVANDGVLGNRELGFGAQIPMNAPGSSAAYDAVSSWTPQELREYFERKGVSAEQTHMWINRRAVACTNWHYDNYDNVLTVCTGRKIVRMRAPAFYLRRFPRDPRPFAAGTESSNHFPDVIKGLDIHECDREDDDCDLEVTLEHGDSVFIPSGWSHCVESAQNTLAISRWWWNDFNTNLSNSIFTDDPTSSAYETPLGASISGRYNLYHFRRAFEYALDGVVDSIGLPPSQKRKYDDDDDDDDSAYKTLPLREDGSHDLFGPALNMEPSIDGVGDSTEFEFGVRARGREILKDIMNTTELECGKIMSAPLNFITLLQEARVAALTEGSYRLAHLVDFIWRELERHAENDPSWDWKDFYDKCRYWDSQWVNYRVQMMPEHSPDLLPGNKRRPWGILPYTITPECADHSTSQLVIRAVMRNQRFAVAYRTKLLLQQTLDRGFKIEITELDDEKLLSIDR